MTQILFQFKNTSGAPITCTLEGEAPPPWVLDKAPYPIAPQQCGLVTVLATESLAPPPFDLTYIGSTSRATLRVAIDGSSAPNVTALGNCALSTYQLPGSKATVYLVTVTPA